MYDDYNPRPRAEGSLRHRSPYRDRDDRNYNRSRQGEIQQKGHSRSPVRSPRQHTSSTDEYRSYRDSRAGYHNNTGYRDRDWDRRPNYYPEDDAQPRGGGNNGWHGQGTTDTLQYDDREPELQADYHRDDYEDRGRRRGRSFDSHSPDRSPARRRPHHTLMLEGLPHDVTEYDILDGFDAAARYENFASDQIKGVRLRTNRRGNRICFVEFHRVADAEDFAERHHFSMTFDLASAGGMELAPVPVSINYSRAREEGAGERGESRGEVGTWRCTGTTCSVVNYRRRPTCFKCGRDRVDGSMDIGPILTGETDEASPEFPSQYLVVRDLEASVTEEVLAKGITKLLVDESTQQQQRAKQEAEAAAIAAAAAAPPAKKLKSTATTAVTAAKKAAASTTQGARGGSLRRVFLMRDRRTGESWRYGFAEFWMLEDAQAAVAKFHALDRFTISSREVKVGFIHGGVFVPVLLDPVLDPQQRQQQQQQQQQRDEMETDKEERPTSFVPVYNRHLRLKYWDDRPYPSILEVNMDNPDGNGAAAAQSPEGGEKGPSSAKGGQDAGGNKRVKKPKGDKGDKAAGGAIVMAPQMQMWAKKRAELQRARQQQQQQDPSATPPAAEDSSMDDAAAAGTAEGGDHDGRQQRRRRDFGPRAPHWRDTYTSYGAGGGSGGSDPPRCLLCLRRFESAQDLRDHEVLSLDHDASLQDEGKVARAAVRLARLGLRPETVVRRAPRDRSDRAPVYVSYADDEALRCLLCERRFRSPVTLRLHERESELHRANAGRPGRVERAVAALRAELGRAPLRVGPALRGATRSRYRDRALERRRLFGQPNNPGAAAGMARAAREREAAAAEERRGVHDGGKPAAAGAAGGAPAPAPAASKGAALLSKMGWSAGQGLGAERSGPAEAIQTELYVPGVGLGAEGGKVGDAATEAARRTRGEYVDFVQVTKDKARERFEKLS